ncbi:efflux transporter outer membrane subunit [Lichenifustis flavocetrariae]|uniref:Efflux transporter outer membrane subunit n=1 Tax=Lichenifustis flavocetrariae TaxID=2949735 RepID=A0AA41ZBZ0_9HYPH|nr:efflux transporter outer membrane subunit [Lichenifustis flavocetrariae]MCW6513077.1 efflux transporter outer membrane subunit [Lichenifustis flavocetrariae]
MSFRIRALSFAMTLGAGLSGCAVGPDYKTPAMAIPARWAEREGHRAGRVELAAWWERFGDRLLPKLVARAVAGNLDVATAKARVREARALRDEAAASLLPDLNASSSAQRSRTAAQAVGFPASTSNLFQADFDASWDLDLFGGNARSVEAKDDATEAAAYGLRSTLLTLVADVARYYVDARGYQARIALARQSAASQRQTVALTEKQFAAGVSTGADLAKARALALSTEANVPALESSYRQTVHRLGVLLGVGPEAVLADMADPRPLPVPKSSVAVGIPADVIRSRPDVAQAERQLAEQTAQVGVEEAQRYPDVTLSGSVGVSAFTLGDITKASSRTWSFGPSASVPILDAGKRRAAVTAQKAVRDQYDAAYRAAVLSAMEDVENALVALSRQRLQTEKQGRSADNYNEAARIARVLYRQGSTAFLDVLDAERSLYEAQDTFIQNQVSLTEDYIALFKALGGNWSGALDVNRPEVVDTIMGPRLRTDKDVHRNFYDRF